MVCCFGFAGIEQTLGQQNSTPFNGKAEAEVDSVFNSMIKAAENLQYDKLSEGVDDGLHAGFITNGSYFAQYDSLIQVMKAKSQGVARQRITVQKEKVTAVSDTIVLLTAYGVSQIEINAGNTFSVKFCWTFIYKKINNVWKVIQSHQSGSK